MTTHREHVLECGRLALRFAWREDRYGHEISWTPRPSDDPQVVLTSIEDRPDEHWPASPPFQSLDVQGATGKRPVVLLVGMAGKSHWSASVELDPPGERSRFDVACRVHPEAGSVLGSRYRVHRSINADAARQVTIGNTSLERGLFLAAEDDAAPARVVLTERTIGITPTREPAGEQTTTIRWGYTVQTATASG